MQESEFATLKIWLTKGSKEGASAVGVYLEGIFIAVLKVFFFLFFLNFVIFGAINLQLSVLMLLPISRHSGRAGLMWVLRRSDRFSLGHAKFGFSTHLSV